jgi:molybdopterin molybdotransferase
MSVDAADRLLSVEEAIATIRSTIEGPLPTEDLAPEATLGRWLAAPVVATTDLPPWDNSAMDGYAVRAADTAGAGDETPVALRVAGEVRAGEEAVASVARGTAVRIATGAPIPAGADAVVPVELTTPADRDRRPSGPRGRLASGPLPAWCLVHQPVAAGSSVRSRADDISRGSVVLDRGTRMTPAAVALAAGAGAAKVAVHRRPRVGVLATGDEIRGPDEPLGPAGIPDSNGPGLRALVAAAGGEPIALGIARDAVDDVTDRLRRCIATVDAVIVSGGVSVGPYDVVREAFGTLGRVELWRVAVQPGKPFAFGTAERPADGATAEVGTPPRGGEQSRVLLFGLPGNPVSTAVTFELFVRPALRLLAGDPAAIRQEDRGVLLEPVTKSAGRRAFLRVVAARDSLGRLERDERGRVPVRLGGRQGSHVLSTLAIADALAIVPESVGGLPVGADVALWWLDR